MAETSISVEVSGLQGATSGFTVSCKFYEYIMPSRKGWPIPRRKKRELPGLYSPIFFDVFLDGVSRGTAWVSITNYSVGDKHRLEYYNGSNWVRPPQKVVGRTIKAKFNVADLNKTPIAIGT